MDRQIIETIVRANLIKAVVADTCGLTKQAKIFRTRAEKIRELQDTDYLQDYIDNLAIRSSYTD